MIGNVGDDVEVLGLHVSPDLDSVLYALAGPERRGARLGPGGRDVADARVGEGVGRRGLVPARRPRPRAPSRADPGAPERRAALGGDARGSSAAAGLATRLLPATDDPLRTHVTTPGGHVLVPGVVRRAAVTRTRWTRSRSRAPTTRAPGARRARGDPGRGRDRVRAEQPVRLARPDPRRRGDPGRRSRRARVPLRRRQPARSAAARCKGPLDRMLTRMAGGTTPAHVAGLLRGLDRRARDRRRRRAGRGRRAARRHGDADDRPRRRAPARRDGARGRGVRVAVVGGTGSFGAGARAAPRRGGVRRRDRLARRGARRGGRRPSSASTAPTNEDAARPRRPRRPRDEGGGDARDGRASSARRSARRPCSRSPPSSRSRRTACSRPPRRRRSPRGSRTCSTAPSSPASTRSPRANLGADEAPEEDALVCGDDADAKALVLELAERITAGRAIDCGPARERPRARGADGGDREREQALQGARGRSHHRRPLSAAVPLAVVSVIPLEGLPELEPRATTSALLLARRRRPRGRARGRRRRRRRAEGRLEGRGPGRSPRRRRAERARRRARRAGRRSAAASR